MAKLSKREQQREETIAAIKAIARRQMAAEGTAAISLRGIARDLDVTAPALYRYFADRNDLITDLLLDAFNAIADAMIAAETAPPRDHYAERLVAVMSAYRGWALEHSMDFLLMYGNPIPGYVAPPEKTIPAATRAFDPVVSALGEALAAGVLVPPFPPETMPAPMRDALAAVAANEGYPCPPIVLYLAVYGWSRIHGIVMLEIFDNTAPILGDPDAFFRIEMQRLCAELNLYLKT
jgi:AcrR family transcriptional regulator